VFAANLASDGIQTIAQLQKMEQSELMRRYGVMGSRLYHLSRGEDDRAVHSDRADKSISAETTFNVDLSTREELTPVLRGLSEKVSARLKKAGIAGRTVVLKLKTTDFKIRTRNRQLHDPTRLAHQIFETGLFLLERELDGARFRLLGIGVHDLTDAERADPPDLVNARARKLSQAEGAIDLLRDKFGGKVVETGYTFGKPRAAEPQQPSDREDHFDEPQSD
jgi:DNA polymerase-4